jgi:hypothetical protein
VKLTSNATSSDAGGKIVKKIRVRKLIFRWGYRLATVETQADRAPDWQSTKPKVTGSNPVGRAEDLAQRL